MVRVSVILLGLGLGLRFRISSVSAPLQVVVHCFGLEDVTFTDVTLMTEETTMSVLYRT